MTRLDIFNYNWSYVRLEAHNTWLRWSSTEQKHIFDNRYKIAVYDSKQSCWYYIWTRMSGLMSLRLWARYLNDDALCITPYTTTAYDYIQFDTLDALQQYIEKEVMVEKL